jgi:dTMP kinase
LALLPISWLLGAFNMVFIVIEGLDASGKTTQAVRLKEHLEKNGYTVFTRFHPAEDNWAGKQTKRFLLAKGFNAHFASAMFYIVDILRSIFLTPWLKYDYIIYVRYLMGTAYLPHPLGIISYHFFSTILPKPKKTIFLDIEPEEAYRRISLRKSGKEMFESLIQLKKIRMRANSLAQENNWSFIKGKGTLVDVEKRILSRLFSKK